MNQNDIELPDDFHSLEGKARIVSDGFNHLIAATHRMAAATEPDIAGLLADITASLLVLHLVVEGMLEDQQRCT